MSFEMSFEEWLATVGPRPRRWRGSYYDGSTPDRELRFCPDCGEACDAVHGHGSGCVSRMTPAGVRTDLDAGHLQLALLIIRYVATRYGRFSSNDTRDLMDAHHIPVPLRSRAFRQLAGEVMTPVGFEQSTEKPRRGHDPDDVRVYRSLITDTGRKGLAS